MSVNIVGKFFDNHSLSKVNRYVALELAKYTTTSIMALDSPKIENLLNIDEIEALESMNNSIDSEIMLFHSYPPIFRWPDNKQAKVVYIQPWEYSVIPSEWQYKFQEYADLLIVPSKFTADAYLNAGIDPSKVKIIPNGYDHNIYNLPALKSEKIFVYVGCAQFRKGIDILLSAWSKVTRHTQNVKLIIKDTPQIYGESDLLASITKLQYITKCAPIEYIDSQYSEQDMASLFKKAQFIVHPHRGEGFGMHIQEAMACGAIPIVTAGGATDDFVDTFKISSSTKIVDMKEIFAIKTDDSLSRMGSYKTVLEPNEAHLSQILQYAIDTKYTDIQQNTSYLQTWEEVGRKYWEILQPLQGKTPVRVK